MMDFIEEKVTPIPAPVISKYPAYEDDDLPF
jgi:hypothetical protein